MKKNYENPTNKKEVSDKYIKMMVPWYKELNINIKQMRFVFFYCKDFVSRDAYIKAGYITKDVNSCDAGASQLLRNPKIKLAIKRYLDEVLGVHKDKLENEIFNILYRQMTYDPSMFMGTDGKPKFETWDEIPVEYRCCVESIETKVYGKDANVWITSMKLVNRDKAIEKLAKYIEMFKDQTEVVLRIPEEAKRKIDDIFNNFKPQKEDTKND